MTISGQAVLHFAPLSDRHIELLMPIEIEAYPEPWTSGMFCDEIRSNRSYFRVVTINHEVIGYCGFWLLLDEAHITHLTVAKAHRGLGYGREQVHHLLDEAHRREARVATLEVRESNTRARALYESLDFRRVGLRKGYYAKTSEDAVVMMKELSI